MNRYKALLIAVLVGLVSILVACTCDVSSGKVYYNCEGNLLPCDDSTYNVGETDNEWANGYFDNITTGSLTLSTPVESTIIIDMAAVRAPAALPPTWRPYKQSQLPGFSDTLINVLYFSVAMPSDYVEGTDISFHVHLVYPNAGIGDSVWYFSYCWANAGDEFPVVDSETVTIASPNVADRHQLANITDSIDGTGKEVSSILVCSIQRLGNHGDDNYTDEIYLSSAHFHYMKNRLGD